MYPFETYSFLLPLDVVLTCNLSSNIFTIYCKVNTILMTPLLKYLYCLRCRSTKDQSYVVELVCIGCLGINKIMYPFETHSFRLPSDVVLTCNLSSNISTIYCKVITILMTHLLKYLYCLRCRSTKDQSFIVELECIGCLRISEKRYSTSFTYGVILILHRFCNVALDAVHYLNCKNKEAFG
jgi:hypothetical protein